MSLFLLWHAHVFHWSIYHIKENFHWMFLPICPPHPSTVSSPACRSAPAIPPLDSFTDLQGRLSLAATVKADGAGLCLSPSFNIRSIPETLALICFFFGLRSKPFFKEGLRWLYPEDYVRHLLCIHTKAGSDRPPHHRVYQEQKIISICKLVTCWVLS